MVPLRTDSKSDHSIQVQILLLLVRFFWNLFLASKGVFQNFLSGYLYQNFDHVRTQLENCYRV